MELIRVSTAEQAARDTPEAQENALDELEQERGGARVERIREPGVSGALEPADRLLVQRLKALAAAGEVIDELRVVAWDRVARHDAFKAAPIIEALKAVGAVVYDVKVGREMDPNTAQGSKDLADLCHLSRVERESIRYRTMQGRKRRLRAGLHPQGDMPWGLSLDGNPSNRLSGSTKAAGWAGASAPAYRWAPDVIAHLTWALGRVIAGDSLRKVSAELWTYRCSPPRGGVDGNGSTLSKIIRSDAYVGKWPARVGEFHHIIQLPVALDPALVADARAALRSRAKGCASSGRTINALMRGRVNCGTCNGPMRAMSGRAGQYRYYRCNACIKGRNINHPMEVVDQQVWATLEMSVFASGALADDVAKLATEEPVENQTETVEKLEKELEKLVRKYRFALDAAGDDGDSQELVKEVRRRAADMKAVEDRLRQERAAVAAKQRAREAAKQDQTRMWDALGRVRHQFAGADFKMMLEVIRALDARIVLNRDGSAVMESRISRSALEFIAPRDEFFVVPMAS